MRLFIGHTIINNTNFLEGKIMNVLYENIWLVLSLGINIIALPIGYFATRRLKHHSMLSVLDSFEKRTWYSRKTIVEYAEYYGSRFILGTPNEFIRWLVQANYICESGNRELSILPKGRDWLMKYKRKYRLPHPLP